MISRHTATSASGSNPSVSVTPGSVFLSGGARASTAGVDQLLRRTYSDAAGSWLAAAKDHIVSAPGTVVAYATRLNTSGIIEPVGKIEIQQSSGSLSSSGTGVRTATGSVSSGWALIGYGANSSYTSGNGRLLFRAGINGSNVRSVSAQSKDHLSNSTGTVRAHWSQTRHVAGSHGMCNPGGPLSASMDPCVATICASDAFCCNFLWDPACVAKVPTMCGKSCTNYTCSSPSFTPAFWNTGGVVQAENNCYNYATNTRTDSFAQPGYSSGGGGAGQCSSPFTAACITEKATADGLIPSSGPNQCDFDQETVASAVFSGDYHWYRLDTNGLWTHKPGNGLATNLDNSGNPITDPATADRGPYTTFVGYFCTCSSNTEGQGHAVIDGPL
jgi:hypothetical protein